MQKDNASERGDLIPPLTCRIPPLTCSPPQVEVVNFYSVHNKDPTPTTTTTSTPPTLYTHGPVMYTIKYSMATCHLPPATCHMPLATCHLPPTTCYHFSSLKKSAWQNKKCLAAALPRCRIFCTPVAAFAYFQTALMPSYILHFTLGR